MTGDPGADFIGRWRIVEIDGFEAGYIDLVGPGHLRLDDAGGHVAFGAVHLSLACSYGETVVHFDFEGSDDGHEVSGTGDAELEPGGTLSGEIRFHHGDEMAFVARRWPACPAG